MKILKWGIVGVLIAEIICFFTNDTKLRQEIRKSQGRKKAQKLWQEISVLNKEFTDTIQHIDYEKKWTDIKEVAREKEKDLQKHIKKLQSYAGTLWEKKMNDIINDIKTTSKKFIAQLQTTHSSAKVATGPKPVKKPGKPKAKK